VSTAPTCLGDKLLICIYVYAVVAEGMGPRKQNNLRKIPRRPTGRTWVETKVWGLRARSRQLRQKGAMRPRPTDNVALADAQAMMLCSGISFETSNDRDNDEQKDAATDPKDPVLFVRRSHFVLEPLLQFLIDLGLFRVPVLED
jgi:hypothetical protein